MAMRNPVMKRRNYIATTAIAAMLAVTFVGAILPTPLYPLFREAFGFSGVTLTLVYAVYVLGNLVALLLFGRLADQIGRRNTALPAISFGITSTVVFAAAAGTAWLFAAPALSGFSTGLAAGAATAWIAETYVDRGTGGAARIAAAANFFGSAAGPLIGGTLAQLAAALVAAAVFRLSGAALHGGCNNFFCAGDGGQEETIERMSLKPRLGVPQQIRLQFVSPAVTGFATFVLIGFYSALIPSLLRDSLHSRARGRRRHCL